MPQPPKLIGAAEAAAMLDTSVSTINRWADSGKLPTAHKGSGIRGPRVFRLQDVADLVVALRPVEVDA